MHVDQQQFRKKYNKMAQWKLDLQFMLTLWTIREEFTNMNLEDNKEVMPSNWLDGDMMMLVDWTIGSAQIHGDLDGEKMDTSELLLENVELIVISGLELQILTHIMKPTHS